MTPGRAAHLHGLAWHFSTICCVLILGLSSAVNAGITNLQQLAEVTRTNAQSIQDVDLTVTVCDRSRASIGVLIVKDDTAVELIQVGALRREFRPGERIQIQGRSAFLRRRELGVEISSAPTVRNDGLHSWANATGSVALAAGRIPVRVDWFNYWRTSGLEVQWRTADAPFGVIPDANFCHAVVSASGQTNYLPGLRAECYEGNWESIPDFNLLSPVKTSIVTNFTLTARSRDERVGIRFNGYLIIPAAAQYDFALWSDDGSLLFLGDPTVSITGIDHGDLAIAKRSRLLGSDFEQLDEKRWITVEGRVNFISRVGEGLSFELRTDRHTVTVRIADADGLDLLTLKDSRIRATGIGRSVMTLDETPVLGKLFVASANGIVVTEASTSRDGFPATPITSVARVQGLPIKQARSQLPVSIRGTVTGATKTSQEHWMSFQDDTRGIFVRLNAISNAAPAFGEVWEVEGHSGAGDFAPIVIADRLKRIGEGLLPLPIRPSWAELLNGSRDVQWAELKGLVTDIRSNTVSLHLPEGRLDVELEGFADTELKPFLKDLVLIRGVLYAVWDASTREVKVGKVMMRNATISVEAPTPADPFDAVERSPRELLLFDAQASAFRPVKVRGQIVYADPTQLFLQADDTGLRLLPADAIGFKAGDIVDAVGYAEIGGNELLLREALLRKIGEAPLPAPRAIDTPSLKLKNLNSVRVRVEGKLLGWHAEELGPVLEMQSGNKLFIARLGTTPTTPLGIRPGSRLALEGVFIGRGNRTESGSESESFELLLNSIKDVAVLSAPPWWTLPRLLALLGLLLIILVVTVAWNTQLRRLVEQRTNQLQSAIRQRERIERQHAIETERSRIARDLHDDLGSSLTEISVLASTGQLSQTQTPDRSGLFNAIGNRARGLISALDVIVWAVDPEDNSLQSLADYLTGYTADFFSHTNISCRFKVPVTCPEITLEGRVRHDLLMATKEALNNVVRHANATEVEFRLSAADGQLAIDIADNGIGIDAPQVAGGHGLKNLSLRLRSLGGHCDVSSRPSGGTIVEIRLPLTTSSESGKAREPR